MMLERLREVLRATPFRPFALHLADGRSIEVRNPDFVSYSPGGRTIHVFEPVRGLRDGRAEYIDLLLVSSIRTLDEAA